MKSHAELTKRQLQVLPYLISCPTYPELEDLEKDSYLRMKASYKK
jgi:hypothetical protein